MDTSDDMKDYKCAFCQVSHGDFYSVNCPGQHQFHLQCLDDYIETQTSGDMKCPICRQQFHQVSAQPVRTVVDPNAPITLEDFLNDGFGEDGFADHKASLQKETQKAKFLPKEVALAEQQKIELKHDGVEFSRAAHNERAAKLRRYPAQIRNAQKKIRGWTSEMQVLPGQCSDGDKWVMFQDEIDRVNRLEASGMITADGSGARQRRKKRKFCEVDENQNPNQWESTADAEEEWPEEEEWDDGM